MTSDDEKLLILYYNNYVYIRQNHVKILPTKQQFHIIQSNILLIYVSSVSFPTPTVA